jgi:hypothetical protein
MSTIDFQDPKYYDIWEKIFSYLEYTEEFPVAIVCKMFCAILKRARELRKFNRWNTSIEHPIFRQFVKQYCNTPENINAYLRTDDMRVSRIIRDIAVPITLNNNYFDSLCHLLVKIY